MALFWLGSAQKANAQITVVNYSDCKFTLTISCPGGGSATSNNYADGWAGAWAGPAGVKVFNVACCANPTITLTFDPSYGSGAKGFANQQASSVNGKTYGCYGTGCNPVNGVFVINWNAVSCTLTLSKPANCN
ncbi:MAG: hypothetical protein MUE96_00180 [Bacteroidia bacterium]|jgi:hypothetical protein|nr:hypothetical protein [Bacteroidia bacterium]